MSAADVETGRALVATTSKDLPASQQQVVLDNYDTSPMIEVIPLNYKSVLNPARSMLCTELALCSLGATAEAGAIYIGIIPALQHGLSRGSQVATRSSVSQTLLKSLRCEAHQLDGPSRLPFDRPQMCVCEARPSERSAADLARCRLFTPLRRFPSRTGGCIRPKAFPNAGPRRNHRLGGSPRAGRRTRQRHHRRLGTLDFAAHRNRVP